MASPARCLAIAACLAAPLLLAGTLAAAAKRTDVRIRDPFVLPDPATQTYYIYGTTTAGIFDGGIERKAVLAFPTKDLENWGEPVPVWEVPADHWGRETVWAPEVHLYRGKYYLFVTLTSQDKLPTPPGRPQNVRRGTEILVADSPLGPFRPLGTGPQTPPGWMALDGSLWVEDGVPYLVFCHEWAQITDGSFDVVRLSDDLARSVGEPQLLFSASAGPWVRCRGDIGELYQGKRYHAYVSDGNWLHRTKSGTLLMLWSSYGPNKYAVGLARSQSGSVFGPWEQLPDPLWSDDGGHPMLFSTFDGRLVMVIHQPNRRVERARFFEVEDLGDTLRLKDEITVLAAASPADPAGPVAALPPARLLPIAPDAFAGSSINVVAGLQHTLFTDRGHQFAAFYAADGTLVLARRARDAEEWTLRRTPYRADVNDAHNTVALVADGDGFLHVSWGHHNVPLNYARGLAPGSLELGPREPMTGLLEDRVTYPQFLRLPDGDLLFFHRDGRSGRGNLVLSRYVLRDRSWRRIHAGLIDGEGRRSAYTAATVDAAGVLHLAWNWRDSPDVATNHDLAYARSADGGVTWTTVDGRPLAVPFTAANAGYALRIPAGRSLMNPPSLGVDDAGRPILANYWCPDGTDVPQYHVVRHDGSAWRVLPVTRRTTPFALSGLGTRRPLLSRSVVLPVRAAGGARQLHLAYRDDERGGRIVLASCLDPEAATPTWGFRDLTAGPVGAWEPSVDPVPLAAHGQVHLLVQRVEQRDGNDRLAAAVPPSPVGVLALDPATLAVPPRP